MQSRGHRLITSKSGKHLIRADACTACSLEDLSTSTDLKGVGVSWLHNSQTSRSEGNIIRTVCV